MLRGEAPIRDFLAYDIGRYLWTATVMSLLGNDGIFIARFAAMLYQVLTVCVGVSLVLQALDNTADTRKRIVFAGAVALILNLWATPYYKVFDYGTCILIVAMVFMILTSLSPARWFSAGLILGLAAIMGRNHGIYGVASIILALGFLIIKRRRAGLLLLPVLALFLGTIVGFSPTFILGILKPGFIGSFLAGVIEHVHSSMTATNIPLPVPWPWTIVLGIDGWLGWSSQMVKGFCFIALILVPVLTILALSRKRLLDFTRLHYLLVAAALTGVIYAHYAYSRADLIHLALAIFPLLAILLGYAIMTRRIWPMSIGLLAVSVLAIGQDATILNMYLMRQPAKIVVVNGSKLYVYDYIRDELRNVDAVLSQHPSARDNFLAVPGFPSLYAINKSKMAIWEIYALSPRDATFEAAELARLDQRKPELVLVSNLALDYRPELRYSHMHPLMYKWIQDHYDREAPSAISNLEVYVRPDVPPKPSRSH